MVQKDRGRRKKGKEEIKMKTIYLDNAATTRVRPQVLEKMLPYFTEEYGNPSSIYSLGERASRAVVKAREEVAGLIGAKPGEIYFTAGGSESDNWVLKKVAEAYAKKGRHIITSAIEHHAVLHTCGWLEKQGYQVTYLPVDEYGLVSPEDLKAALRPDTILVSIMMANNEIGTIEPISELAEISREAGALFHTDAVQAVGQIPIDVEAMKIDLLSGSGHKLGGPKGVGFLYVRKGVSLPSFLHGGAQERGKRAGTQNVPAIVGFGEAARLAGETLQIRAKRERELRDYLIKRITSEVPYARLNGDLEKRLPGNANFCFRFVEGESLLLLLDQNGICASSGSACTSGSLDPSHVLLAIGLPHEIAHGSLRLTLSEETTKEDIDYTIEKVKEIVARLRAMSPLYEDFLKQEK